MGLFQSSGELVVDKDNRIVDIDPEVGELLGVERHEAVRCHMEEIVSARDAFDNRYSTGNEALHLMARSGEPIHGFTLLIDQAGSGRVQVRTDVEVVDAAADGSYKLVFKLRPERRRRSTDPLLIELLEALRNPQAASAEPRSIGGDSGDRCHEDLTDRQAEVIRMLADGKHPREIAAELGVSFCTVRRHILDASERLDVHSRVEVVATALRNQLI